MCKTVKSYVNGWIGLLNLLSILARLEQELAPLCEPVIDDVIVDRLPVPARIQDAHFLHQV